MYYPVAFLFFIIWSYGQNPADLAKSDAVAETQNVQPEMVNFPEDDLRNKITSVLSKKGKDLGTINSDGSICEVAAASTARPALCLYSPAAVSSL